MAMELILKKPIEELVPAMIAFNNEELKKEVQARLKNYAGMVYTDEQIGKAKQDRALLNKFSKALNEERLKIKRLYEEPYLQFKSEVDEVISLVNTTSSKIAEQIEVYEENRKAEKLEQIKEYFDSQVGDLEKLVSYDKLHNDKWLNVGSSMKAIQKEIDEKIEQIRNEITTIEALKSKDEETVKAYYFRNLSLSDALMQAEALRAERERIAEIKLKAEEEKKQEQVQSPSSPQETPEEPKSEPTTYYTLRFEVTATAEQLQALKECLLINQINYKKI